MSVIVVVPPSPFVTTAEAKKHLLVEHSDDDGYIDVLVKAATGWLDGPGGWLGRALGRQTLQLAMCSWPSSISGFWDFELPFRPVDDDSVAISYLDANLQEQPVMNTNYRVHQGNILLSSGYRFPVTGRADDAVRIQYEAGYPEGEVPAPIKVAVLMLVSQWFNNRTPVVVGATVEALPFAVDALLSPYRVYS